MMPDLSPNPGNPANAVNVPVSAMPSVRQAFRFGMSDLEHVAKLLKWADFSPSARVLDLGSGSGYVAGLMQAIRPDLSMCLVDKDPAELATAPADFHKHCADLCRVPELDNSFDAVICCYAMGYVDGQDFFREIGRVLRPGGVVFIVDMTPTDDAKQSLLLFGYDVRSRSLVEPQALSTGLVQDFYMAPSDNSGWGTTQFQGAFKVLFGEVRPAVWRFKKP